MKFNKIFLGLACVAAFSFASCEDIDKDFSDSKTAPVDPSCAGVEFASGNITTLELDPSAPQFALTVQRKNTDAASYEVKVVENEGGSFDVPSTVTFAAGETTTALPISMKESAAKGTPLKLTLTFDDALLNPYTAGLKAITVKSTIIKWESVGRGYWIGNIINTFFGVDPQLLYVELERAETASEIKYRFDSPYSKVAADQDELGAFDGYPYNEDGDLNGVVEKFIFNIAKSNKAVTLASSPINLGMNYGYGDFMLVAGSGKAGSYTATETGGILSFPASTFGLAMTEYNDGAAYGCGECVLYLSADDFIAANGEEEEEPAEEESTEE